MSCFSWMRGKGLWTPCAPRRRGDAGSSGDPSRRSAAGRGAPGSSAFPGRSAASGCFVPRASSENNKLDTPLLTALQNFLGKKKNFWSIGIAACCFFRRVSLLSLVWVVWGSFNSLVKETKEDKSSGNIHNKLESVLVIGEQNAQFIPKVLKKL